MFHFPKIIPSKVVSTKIGKHRAATKKILKKSYDKKLPIKDK